MKHKREYPGATPYRDRHGKRRWRYRKGGFSAELGAEYASVGFIRRYEAAVEGQRVKGQIGAGRTVPGSFSALVASWYKSPVFLALSAQTKKDYRSVIEEMRAKHGKKRVSKLERRHIIKLLAEKASTPTRANKLRKRLVQLLDHAIDLGWRTDNPAKTVRPYKVESPGYHTWDEGEIDRFLEVHQRGSVAYLAMTIMLYTGAAKVDAVKLGPGNIKDGRIEYIRQKTKRSNGQLVSIPLHPILAEAIRPLMGQFTFLETAQGRVRSAAGLGTDMRKWCDAATLPWCTSHGLRKAICRRLAEAGATAFELMAISGHKNPKEVQPYIDAADREIMADGGMRKLIASTKSEQALTNHPKRFAKTTRNPMNKKGS